LIVYPASEASFWPFNTILIALVVVQHQCQQCRVVSMYVRLAQSVLQALITLRHPSYGNPVSAAFHHIAGLLLGIWHSATWPVGALGRAVQGCPAAEPSRAIRRQVIVTHVTYGHTPTASQILVACQQYNQQCRVVFIQG